MTAVPRPLPPAVLAATGGATDAVCVHIQRAAQRVISRRGLTAASTRAVAREAGVSEGTLYNYFDDHVRLLASAIVQRARELTGPVAELPSRSGKGTVAGNLELFVRKATTALDQLIPSLAAAFSDRALLSAVRREMGHVDALSDPARIVERYLLAERDLGRVRRSAEDCRTAAALVVSLCHDDAFERYLHGAAAARRPRHKEIALIARSLTA